MLKITLKYSGCQYQEVKENSINYLLSWIKNSVVGNVSEVLGMEKRRRKTIGLGLYVKKH